MGIEMGLGGDSMQKKYFGNMTHPILRVQDPLVVNQNKQ